MKWILGPAPEGSGPNSTTTPGQLDTQLVEGIEADLIDDGEGQMMQSDVGAPIERDRFAGRVDLPQRHNVVSIGYEHRWIIRPLADDPPSKTIKKNFLVLARSRTLSPTWSTPHVLVLN